METQATQVQKVFSGVTAKESVAKMLAGKATKATGTKYVVVTVEGGFTIAKEHRIEAPVQKQPKAKAPTQPRQLQGALVLAFPEGPATAEQCMEAVRAYSKVKGGALEAFTSAKSDEEVAQLLGRVATRWGAIGNLIRAFKATA